MGSSTRDYISGFGCRDRQLMRLSLARAHGADVPTASLLGLSLLLDAPSSQPICFVRGCLVRIFRIRSPGLLAMPWSCSGSFLRRTGLSSLRHYIAGVASLWHPELSGGSRFL